MKILDTLATANRNLARSKLRTLLTILAIFVGGFTLTLTTGLNTGASQYLDRQLGNVSVPGVFEVTPKTDLNPFAGNEVREYDPNKKELTANEAYTTPAMTVEDKEKLQKVEGVESVVPYYALSGEYIQHGDGKKYRAPQLMQHFGLKLDLSAGRLPTKDDRNAAVLPESYLAPLGFSAQDAPGKLITIAYRNLEGKIEQREFTVIGVMRKTFVTTGQMFIDVNAAKDIADAQGQSARFIAIMVTFKDATDATDETVLKERLQNAGNYTANSLKEQIGTLTSVVGAVTAALNVVGIIALLAASFGIINTLLMSVYERTQEIGLMKALGMHRRTVFAIFAWEAVLVGFWGSLVACGIAYLTSLGINSWASSSFLKDFEGFELLVVSPVNILFVMGLIMLIAFIAGTLPAYKASRLNPIDALRSE